MVAVVAVDGAQVRGWQLRRESFQPREQRPGLVGERLTQCSEATHPLLRREQVTGQVEAWPDPRRHRVKLGEPRRTALGRAGTLALVVAQERFGRRPTGDPLLQQELQRLEVGRRLRNGECLMGTQARPPELVHDPIDI